MLKHPYINDHFINEHGEKVSPEPQVYQQIAELLGEPQEEGLLPSVKVFQVGKVATFNVNAAAGEWKLVSENGEILTGEIAKKRLTLPKKLATGYYTLTLTVEKKTYSCQVIITPKTAYQAKEIKQNKKLWGSILQLYTLRSEHNWGIGDFTDLKQFLTRLAEKGGDFVGLNPIHSLFPANPESASPYSPSSRLWQNIIYIDVSAIDAFNQSAAAQSWFYSQDTQQRLKAARAKDYVDYAEVMALKLQGLRLAFSAFCEQDQTAFEQFIQQNGKSLNVQATFDALHQWLSDQFNEQWGWNAWDKKYQDYAAPAVATFQKKQANLVRFYMWLQFIAEQQLAQCHQLAQHLKMSIGFYRDLAVGVADNGAETWADKDLYVLGASVGAPPDILGPQGQNWGLSPMHPEVLQKRGYQPYIDLLRANMRHCGALRIDHILGFARMWWVAKGESAKNGLYVRYPLEDLLAILALESQRHQCTIIAEALGTVPEGMLEALEEKGILAYNIFYFEYENDKSKALSAYPYQAMTTLSTHDLPTIQGFWKCYDFELGSKYGVYPSEEILQTLLETRHKNKLKIREAVEAVQDLEPDYYGVTPTFSHQLQTYVADTNSALFGTQPEDWLHMLEPVNIPGTSSEYPNWRRKLSRNIDEIFDEPAIVALLEKIRQKRQK